MIDIDIIRTAIQIANKYNDKLFHIELKAISESLEELESLRAENARLREALEFYGDETKYNDDYPGGLMDDDCGIDFGHLAREALKGK